MHGIDGACAVTWLLAIMGGKQLRRETLICCQFESIISQSEISSRVCWPLTLDRLPLILGVQGREMMIGLCARARDSAACFIHTMDVSVRSAIREYTGVLLSEGVTLLILTEPIRVFFLRSAIGLT